ncbi:hypothetical protein [Streptomyces yaizuensis]|uniref:hypothetical protein n=1 Tax=Streptomyces yaizuensis TaxID=2989713 RepID=UPI002B1FFC25|nr:hypothetical protein [Streptomyces sp. YSPA8]
MADDREPWAQQPGETEKAYGKFLKFLELGLHGGRSLTKAAEMLTLSYGQVRNLASRYLWESRASAYDAQGFREAEAEWRAERRQALADDAKILRAATGKLAAELQRLGPLSPDQFLRLLDITMRHRRVLYGDPTEIISLAGESQPGQDVGSVVAQTFAKLSPENRRAQLIDLAERLRRRQEAASGGDG